MVSKRYCRAGITKFQRGYKHNNVEENKPFTQIFMDKVKNYVILFLETSSIHGLNHLVAARRHPCEIFLWLTMMILSVCGTVYISGTTWSRYQSSPTVVSMDRDMFAWNTTFPCVTICPIEKIDTEKLDNYLNYSTVEDKEKLEIFIKALANATFENFDTVPKYNGIAPEDYLETLLDLSVPFKPTITIGAHGVNLEIVPTVTEMGLCYAINSEVAVYNSPGYRKANRWDIIKTINSSLSVHPLDGEVFAQAINVTSYNAYIHGPLEVPDISTKHHHSPAYFYMKLLVTASTVYTAPEAARLSVAQRRCRFQNENNLKHNSVYSYTMCRVECRIRLCLKYCQCIPYFYRRIDYTIRGRWGRHVPKPLSDSYFQFKVCTGNEKLCDVKGLHCLSNHTDVLLNLRYKGGKKVDCECFPICDDVNYVVQSSTHSSWVLGTGFQWGLYSYPRIRYRREIIFGFTDVLVAVGGMAGLFLGCSVLSFMEIVYFMTLRLICYTKNTIKE